MWGWYNINLCVWGCFVWADGAGGRSLAVLGLLLCVVDSGLLLCLGLPFWCVCFVHMVMCGCLAGLAVGF